MRVYFNALAKRGFEDAPTGYVFEQVPAPVILSLFRVGTRTCPWTTRPGMFVYVLQGSVLVLYLNPCICFTITATTSSAAVRLPTSVNLDVVAGEASRNSVGADDSDPVMHVDISCPKTDKNLIINISRNISRKHALKLLLRGRLEDPWALCGHCKLLWWYGK
jgi:hypothetical protein